MTTSLRATTICALIFTSLLVGCARRPALTAIGEAPAAPSAAPAATAERPAESDGRQLVVVERREEIVAAERPEPATFAENANVKAVYFDFDRYDIRPGDATTLEADAAWLKKNDVLILIEGQCDERGTVEYNLATLERNAKGDAAIGEQLQESRRRLGQIAVLLGQVIVRAGELQQQVEQLSK